jgi:nucleotide-binding universal stress UspA family protein
MTRATGRAGPPPLFRRILVPLDLGQRNTRAIATARGLARAGASSVALLHVVERVPGLPVREMAPFYRRLAQQSERALQRVARAFAADGVATRVEVRVGEPAREIVRATLDRSVDIVVMGSHRVRPGRRSAGWGTTSYKVGIFCQCPVLLVK